MDENGRLTLGSLFDGSGGFPLGGFLAGITPVWASEIEPFPIRVTTKRLPFVKHYGDVNSIRGDEVEPVDIITFGSPCQNLSIAGKRAGLEGKQSSLFYQAIRIVEEMRCATDGRYPRFIVWENVPGAFSSNGGEDFRAVLEAVQYFGFSRRKFFGLLRDGKFKKYTALYGRRRLILRSEFEKYLEENPEVKEGLLNGGKNKVTA